MWDKIKAKIPGFIQGLTKEATIKLFKSKVTADMKAVSVDGSAFDSSQLDCLMKVTDNIFWERITPLVENQMSEEQWQDPKKSAKKLVEDATKTKLSMFTKIEGADLPEMPENARRDLSGFGIYDTKDWIYIPIKGTTFSGHPTRTTLGNTLRSLLYMYYYLVDAGISNPWDNDSVFVIASGDDVV